MTTALIMNIGFAVWNLVTGGVYIWHVRQTKKDMTAHSADLKAQSEQLAQDRATHLGQPYKRCDDCNRLLAQYEEKDGKVRCRDKRICNRLQP